MPLKTKIKRIYYLVSVTKKNITVSKNFFISRNFCEFIKFSLNSQKEAPEIRFIFEDSQK